MEKGFKKSGKDVAAFFASSKAQAAWSKAKEDAKSGGFPQFDDGRYKCRWVTGGIGTNQNGELMVTHDYKILEAPDDKAVGKILKKFFNLERETSLKFLIQDFRILGHELDSPEDIDAVHGELNEEKPKVWVALKTNGEYQNKWLQNVIDEEAGDDEESEEATSEEESDEEDEDAGETSKETAVETDEETEETDLTEESEEDEDEEELDEEDVEEKPAKKAAKVKPGKTADEKEEDDTEEVHLAKGMRVKVEWRGAVKLGTIQKIDETAGKAIVKLNNGKLVKVGPDAIKDRV